MKNNILCIDTCKENLNLLLVVDGKIFHNTAIQLKEGNNLVLEYIQQFLQEHDLLLKNINYLAYVAGPGSFTGIRIGTSVVQSLNLVYGFPVIKISRIHLLAEQTRHITKENKVIIALNALRSEYYFGEYYFDVSENIMKATINDCLYTEEKLVNLLSSRVDTFALVSDSQSKFDKHIKNNVNILDSKLIENNLEALFNIISYNKNNNKIVDATKILPNYLKNPHINKVNK
ncbi:MAG: tRNA (adenosine(37)-N6)-threonylcarbamoyltransferase complex dimerization subunit type 1 TsaB [Legionellales bacterium]|nr:tRNA (adenosine(37)-N6)-threonylcarbamoyltransferase complex dimerization subunit type 1 TsaB [Legionellales bacterium]